MMRHLESSSVRLLVGAALLLAGLPGCKPAKPHEEEKQTAPVKAEPARRVALGEYTELLGATEPLPGRAAHVSSPVAGQVLWVLGEGSGPAVTEGKHIDKDTILVQLDDRILKASRAKAQAALDEMQEQKRQAGIAVELARLDRERLEKLAPGSAGGTIPLVSRMEVDKARLASEDAESKFKAWAAREQSLKADIESLDVQIGLHKLKAPIAGRLGVIQVNPGQTLSAGATVAEVIDLSQIDVLCAAPPAAAARLTLGQPAVLDVEEGVEHEARPKGRVEYIAVQAQPETGNFLVKVRFPNPDWKLRAGMVVRTHVMVRPVAERLTIPEAALLEDQNEAYVVVVEDVETKKDEKGEEEKIGKARRLKATVGVRDREQQLVEILRLEDPEKKKEVSPEGLLFVKEGGHGLHNDDNVKLEEEEEKHEPDEKDEKHEK
jgi:RND family efflux transporter MFP subunit